MTWLQLVLVAVAVTALIGWFTRRKRASPARQRQRFRRELLQMAMGDEGVVQRLTEFERSRNPALTDTGCYRAAIKRMRR